MSDPEPPIVEDDLHGYVDGQLPPSRRSAVEQYLADDPDAARRVAAWQRQRAALRAAFASQAGPLPEQLRLDHILRERAETHRRRQFVNWRIVAGFVLALGFGGTAGWLLHNPPAPSRATVALNLLEQEALSSYQVYAADQKHPVEVSAADTAHLREWLSNRLRRTISPPDLSRLGYRLIGGRLLATEHGGAAALFMYDGAAGNRVSVLMRPMAPSLQMPETDSTHGSVNTCAWIANGMGYAIVAALPEPELDRLADQIQSSSGAG